MSSPVRGGFAPDAPVTWSAPAAQPASSEMENIVIMGDVLEADEVLFWVLDGQLTHVYHALETGTCQVALYRVRAGVQASIGVFNVIAGATGPVAIDPATDLNDGDRIYLYVNTASTAPQATHLHFGCRIEH